jgi:restriction endonuclease Mrr
LHHYSAAEGVIIHLGEIESQAVNESREESVEPITLIDRETFVELLIRHGIGVRTYTTPITMVDSEFIEALKL